ncbi:MAG: hypothetical protein C4539_07405 [Ignavibacteriales bacterium]|nr:MAG: hypothetical protein C4539_07405 [Ignavibacteriales bacterium]
MKQFRNYNFDFDKNERKILTNFAKQVLKQLGGDNKYFAEERAYNSILEKLGSAETIKLTKDEYYKLSMQLKENVKFLKPKAEKGFFLKRWLYKSVYLQYKNLIEKYFSD